MACEATSIIKHGFYILQAVSPNRIVELLIEHWALITIGGAGVIVILVFGLLLWKLRSKKAVAKPQSAGAGDQDVRERISSGDYQLITDRILQVGGKYKSILFAAAGLNSLPITIPVNVAIQIAQRKKRCLLIDLDLKRDAAAKAFNISDKMDPKDLRPKPYKTPFEGLLLWPGRNFTMIKQMNIKALVDAATEKFDLVLVNAPYLDSSPDRAQIASAAHCSILFTQSPAQAGRLAALMQASQCKLIGNIQVNAEKQ